MKLELTSFLDSLKNEIKEIQSFSDLEILRLSYITSKNSKLNKLSDQFKKLTAEEKKLIGTFFQSVKQEALLIIEATIKQIKIKDSGFRFYDNFDPNLSKYVSEKNGSLHPYTELIAKIQKIFNSIGFEVVDGPVLESDYYNFTALNIPEDHPARADHDTFYIEDSQNLLLRTHTSTIQVREAQKREVPIAIIAPGIVYRNEATDASHDFMFYQLEGLYINKDASVGNLLYTVQSFLKELFDNENIVIRARPSYFPFVEPGLEFDMSCPFCMEGCSVCKKTCWIEIGGAGMVHPFVLKEMNIVDPKVKGWAFGLGLTRLAMIIYNIKDIRLLHGSIVSK